MDWRIAYLIVVLATVGCAEPEPIELHGQAMGTTWTVSLARLPADCDRAELADYISQEIERVEAELSHWRKDSDVSRFNRHHSTEPVRISQRLRRIMQTAQQVHEQSGGALDVTVAPLVDRWGFGPQGQQAAAPSDEELARLRESVGAQFLELGHDAEEEATLIKRRPELRIDLSAIAKGYAVDWVADRLELRDVHDYLIEIGGELRAYGKSPAGRPWRVGLEQPDPLKVGAVRRTLLLDDQAVATSGVYRLFREESGKQVSHVIDPRTARPVTHDLVSVSVVADTAMEADAWATALLVLGPDEGFQVAQKLGLAATFLRAGGEERSTSAFKELPE